MWLEKRNTRVKDGIVKIRTRTGCSLCAQKMQALRAHVVDTKYGGRHGTVDRLLNSNGFAECRFVRELIGPTCVCLFFFARLKRRALVHWPVCVRSGDSGVVVLRRKKETTATGTLRERAYTLGPVLLWRF